MTGIAIQELSEVDLDDLDHLDRGGLSQHFRRIAVRATAGQLRSVLGQSAPADEDGPMDLRSLVDSYVDQYTRTAMRLRTARTRFSALSLGVPDSPSIPHGDPSPVGDAAVNSAEGTFEDPSATSSWQEEELCVADSSALWETAEETSEKGKPADGQEEDFLGRPGFG